MTTACLYYSDCRGDEAILETCRTQLARVAPGPIIAVTLAPVDFGDVRIVLDQPRGQLTMFRQILAGLEAAEADICYLTEHDVAYAPDHFAFVPPRADTFYYNQHRWQLRALDGFAVHYRASQTSGCVAARDLLLAHYRARVAHIEQHGWERNIGYEPGTNARSRAFEAHQSETWMAARPNVDIRHGHNLTASKWAIRDFRNKANAIDWREADAIPYWGRTRGRFREWLVDVAAGWLPLEQAA